MLLPAMPAYASGLPQWLAARVDSVAPGTVPVFIPSYDVIPGRSGFDIANADTAFTYDQALAITAFLAMGDVARARRIGDALLYAQANDRFWHDGRLRNAYVAGVIGEGAVKLPGYWEPSLGKWIEDGYKDGSATGNNAWAGLALMQLADASGDNRYAEGARRIGRWLTEMVAPEWKGDAHSSLGLRGGFEGFEPDPAVLGWRSTEHNADALALFQRLQKAFPDDGFTVGVVETTGFLTRMFSGGRFEVGTTSDGSTVNTGYSGLDAQLLPILALKPASRPLAAVLAYAEAAHGVPGGFNFSTNHAGIWAEGTAQAALVYRLTGQAEFGDRLIAGRLADHGPDGGVYAIQGIHGAPIEMLSTGLQMGNGGQSGRAGEPWKYYRRIHVAPAAWLIMAEAGYNPLAAVEAR